MKSSRLVFAVLIMVLMAGFAIVSVRAGELYNKSQNTGAKTESSLYNKSLQSQKQPKLSSGLKVIDNTDYTSASSNISNPLDYQIKPRQEAQTFLTKLMDPYAVQSRAEDVKRAIKNEYEGQIDTQKKLKQAQEKFSKDISKLEQQHQKKVQEYELRKQKEEEIKRLRKSGQSVSALAEALEKEETSPKYEIYNNLDDDQNDMYDRKKTGKKLFNSVR